MGIVKWIHVSCAIVSIVGFFVRGMLMINESYLLQSRAVKIVPHVVDTLLLVSAIILASQWGWAALQLPWLLAKMTGLLLYIALGMVALRMGKTKSIRVSAWIAAMGVFAYIAAVALTKSPLLMS